MNESDLTCTHLSRDFQIWLLTKLLGEMRFSPVETERGVGVDFLEFIGVRPKGQDENRLKNYHLVEKPPFQPFNTQFKNYIYLNACELTRSFYRVGLQD